MFPLRPAWLRWFMVGLLGLLSYNAVMGKGGWFYRQDIRHQLDGQHAINLALSKRNQALRAEVSDLKSGSQAIEEVARNELGMIRSNEVFYQYDNLSPRGVPARVAGQASQVVRVK